MIDITWIVFLIIFVGIPVIVSLCMEDIDVDAIPFDDEDEV